MIVVDTSVILAALSSKDTNHDRALGVLEAVTRGAWGRALIPEWVFVEVANFVLRKFGRARAIQVVAGLANAADSAIIPCTPLFGRSMEIFTAPGAPALSFADAGIVAAAEAHGAKHIASFDNAFRAFPSFHLVTEAPAS